MPLAWGYAQISPPPPKIKICGTHHDAIHTLLDLAVRAGAWEKVAGTDMRLFDGYTRLWAKYAWDHSPLHPGQRPYTLTHAAT